MQGAGRHKYSFTLTALDVFHSLTIRAVAKSLHGNGDVVKGIHKSKLAKTTKQLKAVTMDMDTSFMALVDRSTILHREPLLAVKIRWHRHLSDGTS